MSLLLLGTGAAGAAAAPAPSVRNATTGQITTGSDAVTLPTRVSGDALVAVVSVAGAAPTENTGWLRRVNETAGDLVSTLAVYTRTSDGTDNTPLGGTLMSGGTFTVLAVKDVTTGYDVSGSGTGNDASIVAPTVTATGAPAVLISAYLRCAGSGTITPPGGQTATDAVVDGSMIPGHTLRCASEALAASGATGTRTATNSTSTNWVGANVVVK